MIGYYLAVAFHRFAKAPFTTLSNLLILALGLAGFMAAASVATFWRSGDAYHDDAARTFLVGQGWVNDSQYAASSVFRLSSASLARYLMEDIPEIESAARATGVFDMAVAAEGSKTLLDGAFVDPAFLDIFDLDFVAGGAVTALAEPGSIILTQEAAARLFRGAPALGRTVIVNDDWEGRVTGVIAPVRQPSFMGHRRGNWPLTFSMLARQNQPDEAADNWGATNTFTFVKLSPSFSLEALNTGLATLAARRIPQGPPGTPHAVFGALPVSEMTVSRIDDALFPGTNLSAVAMLLGLGALTLVVACVNYANLASAEASRRAKEIGVRKVTGTSRAGLMIQFGIESVLLTVAAAGIALAILVLAAPIARSAADVDILFLLDRGLAAWAALAGLIVLVAIAAAAYPALVLSRVHPVEALYSERSGGGPRLVAQILVGVQILSASFLLILVAVTELQRNELERTVLPPRNDAVLVLNDLRRYGINYFALEAELSRLPSVEAMTVIDNSPWGFGGQTINFTRSLDPNADAPPAKQRSVGYDYFSTVGLELLAGRGFDREREPAPTFLFYPEPGRMSPIVIDRAYADALGFETPAAAVGEIVHIPKRANLDAQQALIIGVTEAEVTDITANQLRGLVYVFTPAAPYARQHVPLVRVDSSDVPGAIAAVTRVWDEFAPNVPANIRFYSDIFEQEFAIFTRFGQLFALLAVTAFVIASLGHLGIAVHVAGKRRHEIGVRKTLGFTTWRIARLLLVDLAKPVLIANLLAWPLAYFGAQIYLASFAHRVELTLSPFVLSLVITLVITCAAVIGEVWKAACIRPAEVLRNA